ncbi:glycosyltransferase family 92 protein F13G3.3-like [Oryzias latipes]|uniref:glycosyltransferase family 92 protein F13G3.3-like n=1 Tax=Oryzias latipes TaxID=8090 RepID=UPI0002A4B10E|nr:glycosyltransferase family 92 protein F13G3.3-like [Oryzias latipes]
MKKNTYLKKITVLLFIITPIIIIMGYSWTNSTVGELIRERHNPSVICPRMISQQSITPLKHTKHLLVSAYMDQRSGGFDLRIIGIFKRDSVDALYCSLCCAGLVSETTPSIILPHSDHFGFPYGTMDVLCQIPDNCDATHVTLLTAPSTATRSEQLWIPIKNKKTSNKEENKLDLTVCISTLFGTYNNVLQFAQTLEMYRLLGVNRVVIYNTSCGLELNRLLKSYSQEGFVEMVPWPIDRYLNPSRGWNFKEHGGDLHYFGQLTTLNECIYRSMERSRYVLLNDIDEIIMPYQHDNLNSMMDMLQSQHPNVAEFLIENHIFPKKYFEPSRKFHLHRWSNVPGINILEHIYREDPNSTYHPYKMIVQPRLVEQTSVHQLLRNLGEQFYVPMQICRIIHVRVALLKSLQWEELNEDKRLWDFQEKLIPNVDQVLRRAGLLTED